MQPPATHYATLRDDRIAYQVLGSGDRDLVFSFGQWGHLDLLWEEPAYARFVRRLAAFSRVILFDPLGMGLSVPRPKDGRAEWQHWADELQCVMGAVQSKSVAILERVGTVPALSFAAHFPKLCAGLILWNTSARIAAAPDYPEGYAAEVMEKYLAFSHKHFGTEHYVTWANPSLAKDERARIWACKLLRAFRSHKEVMEILRNQVAADSRDVLSAIDAPTLVMHRARGAANSVAQGRHLAAHIRGARFVEVPGADQEMAWEAPDLILGQIEEFLTGRRVGTDERALTTVLFTDIAGSTERAARLGDAAWRALLDRHDRVLREQIGFHGGKLVETTGDGTLSTFDHPGQAIRCAFALAQALKSLQLQLRAGLHFGEVERREDGRIGGIAVHIGARVMALAAAGEVLLSRTVRDVLLGSHYGFKPCGVHELKGVPGDWPLFVVDTGRDSPRAG